MMIVSHRSKVTQIGDVDLISYSFLVSGSAIDSHRNVRCLQLPMAVEEIRVTTGHNGLPGTTSTIGVLDEDYREKVSGRSGYVAQDCFWQLQRHA